MKRKNNTIHKKDKFQIIYKKYFLDNQSSDNSTFNKTKIITFAGIPSSGKSTISKHLQERYGGVLINLDIIMEIINKNKLMERATESEILKREFAYHIIKQKFKNQLIILDSSIDREYKAFLRICDANDWDYFIIQLDLSKEEAIKRFKSRNPENLKNWIPRLNGWIEDHEKFKQDIKPAISLKGINPTLEILFEKLNKNFLS